VNASDSSPPVPERTSRTEYAKKLLRELGGSLKLAGAGLLTISATEWFGAGEAADRSATWVILLLALIGATFAVAGNLLTAEAER